MDCTSTLEVKPTETGKLSKRSNLVKSPSNAKGPSYVQIFLDMYMKKKKNPKDISSNKEAFPEKAATVEVTLVANKRILKSIKKTGSEKTSEGNKERCPVDGNEAPKPAHKHDSESINTIRTEKGAGGSLPINNEIINETAKYVPEEITQISEFNPNTKAEKSDLMNKGGESVSRSIEKVKISKEGYYDTKAESDVEKFKGTIKCAKKCEASNAEKYKLRDLEGVPYLEVENHNCDENLTRDNKESAETLAEDLLEGFFDMNDSFLFPDEAAEEKAERESKNSVEATGKRCNETEVTKRLIEDTEIKEVADKEGVERKIDSTRSSFFTDVDEKVKKGPFMYSISRKYGSALQKRCKSRSQPIKSKGKDKLKMEDIERAMEFEDSLFKPKKRKSIEQFKFPKKKKFSHTPEATYDMPDSTAPNAAYAITEILEPKGKDRHETFLGGDSETTLWQRENGHNLQKSITWRSPLVYSPAVKHSPKISFHNISHTKSNVEADTQNETTGDTSETSITSKSNSNLTQTVQSTQNDANRKIGQKKCGSPFPLRDKDYGDSLQNDERYDDGLGTCSTSLLENLGFPSNQYKATPKSRKPHPSLTFKYYSQLLSQPTELKREKIEVIPQSSENTRITDNEDRENFNSNYGMYGEVSGQEPLQDISNTQRLVSNAYKGCEYDENGFIDRQECIPRNKNTPHPYKPQVNQDFLKNKPRLHTPLYEELYPNFSTEKTNHDLRYPEYNERYTELSDDKWLDDSLNSLTCFDSFTNVKQVYDNTLKANHTRKTPGGIRCLQNVDYDNQYPHSLEYDETIKNNKAGYQSMSNPQRPASSQRDFGGLRNENYRQYRSSGRFGDLRSGNELEPEPSLQSGRFGGLRNEYAPRQSVSGRYHQLQRENVLFDESQNDSASQRGTSVYDKLDGSTFGNSRNQIAPLIRPSSSNGGFDELENGRFDRLHSGRRDELQRQNVQQLMSHGRFEELGNTPYHNLSLARSRYANFHGSGTGNSIRECGPGNWESGRLDNWQCDNFNQSQRDILQSEDIPRQRQRFISDGDGELQVESGNAQQLRLSGLQGGRCNEWQRGSVPQSRSTFVGDKFGEVRYENVPEQSSYLTSVRFNELQGEIASRSNLSFARGRDDAPRTKSSSASNIFGEPKGGRSGKLLSEHGAQADVLMLTQNPVLRDERLLPRQGHQRPEMLSLQDLNRQSGIHLKKSEGVFNRENVNVYSMSEVPVPRQEPTNEFDVDHNGTVPNFLCRNTKIPKEYSEEFCNMTSSSNVLIPNTTSRRFGNRNLPLPYEDGNLHSRLSQDISAIDGNWVRGPSSQYSDFRQGSYQDFSYRPWQEVDLVKSSVAQRNYSDLYVEQGRTDDLFQNDDKEYVLNKYFYSLDE